MCICFSHHLHRGASCEWLQLGLEVWKAVVSSGGAEINRMSRGKMGAWGPGQELMAG